MGTHRQITARRFPGSPCNDHHGTRTDPSEAASSTCRASRSPALACASAGIILSRFEGAGDAPAWPGPATTDEQGRFTLRGLGRSSTITIEASSDRFAATDVENQPRRRAENGRALTLAVSSPGSGGSHHARADDGKPLPGVLLSVLAVGRHAYIIRTSDRCSH